MIETLKKFFTKKSAAQNGRGKKRSFFASLFSLVLLGNLFASHHDVGAAEFPGMRDLSARHGYAAKNPEPEAELSAPESDAENVSGLWHAAALLARPLLFEHEDHALFEGKKKVGNFGVFWPKKMDLPTDSAFRRYVTSEKRIIAFIVDRLGAGPERALTLYQMAQIYSFVHNTTVASGGRALDALKAGGMKAAQNFMARIDRVKGMKEPLRGLAARRKDEAKLGRGEIDKPLSRTTKNGTPHTLASLQIHYEEFVSNLGGNRATSGAAPAASNPAPRKSLLNDTAADPI